MRSTFSTLGAFALTLLILTSYGSRAQAPDLGTPPPTQLAKFYGDTSGYAEVLKQYVDDNGLVDYIGLKVGRAPLDAYLKQAAEMDERRVHVVWAGKNPNIDALRKQQLAFFINVHNARVLQSVIDHYPLSTDNKTSPGAAVHALIDAMNQEKFKLAGKDVTLAELKEKMILERMGDQRAGIATNDATVNSAPLRREPYRGVDLENQFSDQLHRLLASSRGLRIEGPNKVAISPLLKVFLEYAGKPTAAETAADPNAKRPAFLDLMNAMRPADPLPATTVVDFIEHDWSLNEQPKK